MSILFKFIGRLFAISINIPAAVYVCICVCACPQFGNPWLVSSISSESIEGLRDLNYLSMVEKQPCDHLVRSECVLDSLQIHKSDLVPGK